MFFLCTRLVFLSCLWRCGNKFLLRSSNFGVPDSPGTFFVTKAGGLDCVLGRVRCRCRWALCFFVVVVVFVWLWLFFVCVCVCACVHVSVRTCVCMLRELSMQEPKCRH